MNTNYEDRGAPPDGGRRLFSEGLLVTLATGLAYIAVYAYELGYCTYFSIPKTFIVIAVPNLVAAALVMLIFPFVLTPLLNALPIRILRETLSTDWPIIAMVLFLIALAISAWLQGNITWQIIPMSVSAALGFALPFLRKYGRPASESSGPMMPWNNLSAFIPLQTAANVFGGLAVVGVITTVSLSLGIATARERDWFMVTNLAQPRVVLAVFGDNAVAAVYNSKTRIVTPSFIIYEVGKSLPPVTFKETGKLIPAVAPFGQ